MQYGIERRKSRGITVGGLSIGNGAPITVQSMTNADPHDVAAIVRQIEALATAGCDIVRLALPDVEAARALVSIKKSGVRLPIVGDIHFDYRIAIEAVRAGVDKIRINPGNIGSRERVRAVADACRMEGIPIRIGVNSGSLEKNILEKHGAPTPAALAESALYHAELLEACGFTDIALSVKASSVVDMISANRLLAAQTDYPLHLGVTEAGGAEAGSIKSAVGIGALLAEGIGDTVRVSLTADPVLEIKAAKSILASLQLLNEKRMDIVACPTCGRTKIDLIPLLSAFEGEVARLHLDRLPIKVAFMGCVVNGPGEAREADVGVAGGVGEGLIFRHGLPIYKVKADEIIPALIREIQQMKEQSHE